MLILIKVLGINLFYIMGNEFNNKINAIWENYKNLFVNIELLYKRTWFFDGKKSMKKLWIYGKIRNLCWIISYFSRPLLSKYRILCNFHKLYIFIDSKLFIKNCKEIKNLIFHRIICNNKTLHKKLMQSIFLLKYSTLNEILLHTRNRSQQWFLCSFLFVW